MTTQEEQALKVARQYIYGTSKEREVILSCFSDEEKQSFLLGVGAIHLFDDQQYYNATMNALREKIMSEVCGTTAN